MSIKIKNKKSFSLLELLLVISLISIITYVVIPKKIDKSLDIATQRLILYLNQTRLQGFIDDKYSLNNNLWHKKQWTLKFLRCRQSVGGIYYIIYSDKNMSGHPNASDSLKDPLTKKNIYSSNMCNESNSNSSFVLLTKKFDIVDVEISCNETSSLGQLSFSSKGQVYTKLTNNYDEKEDFTLENDCFIKLIRKDN